MNEEKPGKRKLPAMDPGWATVIAAGFALIGTVLTFVLQRGAASPPATVIATLTSPPTQIATAAPQPTDTPTLAPSPTTAATAVPTVVDTPMPAPSAAPTGAPTPLPSVLALLPPAQREPVLATGLGVLRMGRSLNALIVDDFTDNKNKWPVSSVAYGGGIECSSAVEDDAYRIGAKSGPQGAQCYAGPIKPAKDFLLEADMTIENSKAASAILWYRLADDGSSYYYVSFYPPNQTFATGLVTGGQDIPIIRPNYTPDINAEGANRLGVVVVGAIHVIYFNEKMVAMFTDDRLAQGQFRFQLLLSAPDETEFLRIDNVEYRGM